MAGIHNAIAHYERLLAQVRSDLTLLTAAITTLMLCGSRNVVAAFLMTKGVGMCMSGNSTLVHLRLKRAIREIATHRVSLPVRTFERESTGICFALQFQIVRWNDNL